MEPHIWIWVWVLLTVIMSVGEWLEGGGFLLPFAIGGAAAAGLELAFPGSSTAQWIAFLGLSSAIMIFIQRRKLRMRAVPPENSLQSEDAPASPPDVPHSDSEEADTSSAEAR